MTQTNPADQPMDIALLAPLVSPIRQPYLGGAQAMVRDLAVTLARRGHAVTLYAAPDSDPSILPGVTLTIVEVDQERVRPSDFATPREQTGEQALDPAVEQAFAQAVHMIERRAPRHDALHAHAYDGPAFTQAARLAMPTLHTLHMSALDATIVRILGALAPAGQPRRPGQPWLATVSHACAATYQDICRIDAVIYNGLDIAAIPFGLTPDPERYVLFAGRISPEKGVEDAIRIALAAGVPLKLAGDIYDQRYFATRIEPLLNAHPNRLSYLGSRRREEVWGLMAGAAATLVPSLWDEPFGLVACEAQAAGAPVIGYNSGGLREVVVDGRTGVLIPRGHVDEAAARIDEVARFDRRACREHVASAFALDTTVDRYEALYKQMLLAQ